MSLGRGLRAGADWVRAAAAFATRPGAGLLARGAVWGRCREGRGRGGALAPGGDACRGQECQSSGGIRRGR